MIIKKKERQEKMSENDEVLLVKAYGVKAKRRKDIGRREPPNTPREILSRSLSSQKVCCVILLLRHISNPNLSIPIQQHLNLLNGVPCPAIQTTRRRLKYVNHIPTIRDMSHLPKAKVPSVLHTCLYNQNSC